MTRRAFLDRIADFVVSLQPLAVILPGTPQRFKEVERSDAATELLNKGKVVDFTFRAGWIHHSHAEERYAHPVGRSRWGGTEHP